MNKLIKRLFYGALFAIPLMLLTQALVLAAPRSQVESPQGELDCAACHPAFQEAWENSAHGNATKDPAFKQAWEKQGKDPECLACHVTGFDDETYTWEAEGITCQACHSPIPDNHPMEPMATDRSADLCGDCHSDTYFEWQVSAHHEGGIDCSGCHNPHATSLKAEGPSNLCASCHRSRASNFTHSAHSQQGLTCANCHLGEQKQNPVRGSAIDDHSFFVSLSTCNGCHVYQMHDSVEVHAGLAPPESPDSMASTDTINVLADPVPVSPYGFTALSGLIGVALGVIIAPWIERLQRRSRFEYHDEE